MPENTLPEVELGTLEIEDPRMIWPHEERDFTPWLATNIDQLSEAIGVSLRVEQVERRVGDFQSGHFMAAAKSGWILMATPVGRKER